MFLVVFQFIAVDVVSWSRNFPIRIENGFRFPLNLRQSDRRKQWEGIKFSVSVCFAICFYFLLFFVDIFFIVIMCLPFLASLNGLCVYEKRIIISQSGTLCVCVRCTLCTCSVFISFRRPTHRSDTLQCFRLMASFFIIYLFPRRN